MKVNANFSGIIKKIDKLNTYFNHDVFDVVGTEGVNHFKESFTKEGFTDSKLKKWEKPKRTDPNSSWYGFKHGGKKNFSSAATKRPTLSGETQELMNSIHFIADRPRRRIYFVSDKVYAQIHNEGGPMKVFGKGKAIMPKRQFMGHSKKLKEKIVREIETDVTKILNS